MEHPPVFCFFICTFGTHLSVGSSNQMFCFDNHPLPLLTLTNSVERHLRFCSNIEARYVVHLSMLPHDQKRRIKLTWNNCPTIYIIVGKKSLRVTVNCIFSDNNEQQCLTVFSTTVAHVQISSCMFAQVWPLFVITHHEEANINNNSKQCEINKVILCIKVSFRYTV